MKPGVVTLLFLFLLSFVMEGCSFLFKGESAPLKQTVISVTVPTDPNTPTVKPLPGEPDGGASSGSNVRQPVRDVEQHLLPTEVPRSDNPLKAIPLEPTQPRGRNAFGGSAQPPASLPNDVTIVAPGTVITDDTTWRGVVLVKGAVIVAPQSTLRIEAGTTVRFAPLPSKKEGAGLVVQGRIHAAGTAENPILMTSDRSVVPTAEWGGIMFLATEKRNLLEQCTLEHARAAVDARFSMLTLKHVSITHSRSAVVSHDSVLQLTGGLVSRAEIGLEFHDSECEARDLKISLCRRGVVLNRSSAVLSSVTISDNEIVGLDSDESRVRITSALFSANGAGAHIKGGSGLIQLSAFTNNRTVALHLSGARLKVNRCSFSETAGIGVRLEDGRALFWNNAFAANTGFNLYNAGTDDVSAYQNWWGSTEQAEISKKIFDRVREPHSGTVFFFPWLSALPALTP